MGRIKMKKQEKWKNPAHHDASIPLAVDARGRILSGQEFHRIFSTYQTHAETLPICACEGAGNPLLIPPDLTHEELELARSAVLAYIGGLSWQRSEGNPGVPAISEEFRSVVGDLLRPLRCRFLQIGIDADTLRIASEDMLPEEPFGLATRIDTDLGSPSLHIARSLPFTHTRHKTESAVMTGHLTPDEAQSIVDRVNQGHSLKKEMLAATRTAVNRGYVIPGAAGEIERWFRTHERDLEPASGMPSKNQEYLPGGISDLSLASSDARSSMQGIGTLSLGASIIKPEDR